MFLIAKTQLNKSQCLSVCQSIHLSVCGIVKMLPFYITRSDHIKTHQTNPHQTHPHLTKPHKIKQNQITPNQTKQNQKITPNQTNLHPMKSTNQTKPIHNQSLLNKTPNDTLNPYIKHSNTKLSLPLQNLV